MTKNMDSESLSTGSLWVALQDWEVRSITDDESGYTDDEEWPSWIDDDSEYSDQNSTYRAELAESSSESSEDPEDFEDLDDLNDTEYLSDIQTADEDSTRWMNSDDEKSTIECSDEENSEGGSGEECISEADDTQGTDLRNDDDEAESEED